MSKLDTFAETFQHILQTQTLSQIHKNLNICASKRQLGENDCPESMNFFSELRQYMLVQKLLNPGDRIGLSGTGAYSFVLKFPPRIISSKNKTMSLKILSGQLHVAQNEIRALTYTNQRKNDYFIHLEDFLLQNVNGQNICYMLLPHYDITLLDLLNDPSFQDIFPSMNSTINTKSFELTQINDDIVYILEKLFYAIQFMRDNGMAHRDIKLENILIKLDFTTHTVQNIVLSDLGDTCISNESSTIICGTSIYSAPELFYGAMFNMNTTFTMRMMQDIDLYALGQCIYLLLSRKMLRLLTRVTDTNYFDNFSNPPIQQIYKERLKVGQGMHMSDISQMLSSSASVDASVDDTDIFTRTLYGWTNPDIRLRMSYPFDLPNRQQQDEEIVSIIRTLQQKSKQTNPVYHMTYKIQKNMPIQTIQARYNHWVLNMARPVQT